MKARPASIRPFQEPALVPCCIVAIAALALGIFFRFYHLDHKVFSGDEVYTSVRMLGEFEADIIRNAGQDHDAHALWLVLHPAAQQGAANVYATVRGLEVEEPQHSPIYFVLGHLWLGAFGNSIAAVRSLSVVFSLLALPPAFWLAVELYGSRRAGWVSVALLSLSPVGILYAQEAREYSLWTVALFALSAALLRALRLDRALDWWLVAGLSAFALYVDPLSGLVLVGLAAYVIVTRWKERRLVLRCSGALAAGSIAFIPWLAVLLRHTGAVGRGFAGVFDERLSPLGVARSFAGLLRLNILDLNLVQSSRLGILLTALALLLLLAALAFTVRRNPPRVSLFLLFPMLAATLPLLVAGLFGVPSVRLPRYFMPIYLYFDLCFAGLIAAAVAGRNFRGAALGYLFFACLLVARTASDTVSSQAVTWWNKMEDNSIPVARIVNDARHPLLVSDDILDYSLVLANYLRPDVLVILRPHCYMCTVPAAPEVVAADLNSVRVTDLFALGPSTRLQLLLRSAIVRRRLRVAYRCINARHNCVSDLNVEPLYTEASITSH